MRILVVVMVSVLLISAGLVYGGIPPNVKLTVLSAPKKGAEQGGKELRAEALITRIHTTEQLKPVALELLEHLKSSYPAGHSYTVVISDDPRMLKIGNYLAVATFKGGAAVVTGGIPTNMDIRVMMVSRVEVRRPDELGMQVAYEVALLKKKSKKEKPSVTEKEYAQVAAKHKLTAAQVRQMERGITQYYKAFEGKLF
jgi:hypothetical protein